MAYIDLHAKVAISLVIFVHLSKEDIQIGNMSEGFGTLMGNFGRHCVDFAAAIFRQNGDRRSTWIVGKRGRVVRSVHPLVAFLIVHFYNFHSVIATPGAE